MRLDFAEEAPSLKRVEVPNPFARILAVDDEVIVLDSFRKILVGAGYSIDTVESGREALGLVQKHKYDFVFTDLKMPEMDGLDVVKGVKHYSPESDVVVITGYGTIESAVNAMKWGAMDYVQKPFTEDELTDFTKKCLYRRQDRQHKRLSSTVRVSTTDRPPAHEFGLPGGVFISPGHVWANVTVPGMVRMGMDDFARQMLGRIDGIDLPAKGATIKKGERLFSIRQGERSAAFHAPITGQIHEVNAELPKHVTKKLMRETAKLARSGRKVGLHTHVAETKDEEKYCLDQFDQRPAEYMQEVGWVGPDVGWAHSIFLNPAEIQMLAKTGTGVAHCPSSNMRLGSGICPVREMLDAGVNVAIGVDGSASNDTGHLLNEARTAVLLQRVIKGANAFSVEEGLQLATRGGAAVLGRADEIGSLQPGKAADFIGVNLDTLSMAGGAVHDPAAALLLCHVDRGC